MLANSLLDETLAQRLPLPLAQLYRAAANAKNPQDRHGAAYYLWEAGLKLLGSAAVITYAAAAEHDPALAKRLHNLARPAVGHWWEFVRLLVLRLANEDAGFAQVRELLFGKPRDDLPRAAGLDAALLEALQGKASARSTVRLTELFDRLVAYRNQEFGHGASGRKPAAYYERLGRALLLGVGELFGRLDVLAGRRLLYVAEVRRRGDGSWLVERADLSREMYQRVESLVLADGQPLPRPERLYLLPRAAGEGGPPTEPQLLHPLLAYDEEAAEVLFLNARRGAARVEYLCYTSGRRLDRADLAGEQRELLRRVLDMPAEAVQVEGWAARSAAEEPVSDSDSEAGAPRRLGEFDLLSKLGQGGMGVVYRARQPSLGREVALKCLFRSGDPKAEARFAREIHALGRVEHPHLVKIFGSGSEGEHWFYAMELIEGTTLATVCERLQACGSGAGALDLPTWHAAVSTACAEARRQEQPLSDPGDATASPAAPPPVGARSPDRAPLRTEGLPGLESGDLRSKRGHGQETVPQQSETVPQQRETVPQQGETVPQQVAPRGGRDYVRHVVELVRQVCAAAQALHEKGVVHRDIKPGNVMVTTEGGTAVLMDLGLAQVADEVEGRLTRTRQFVGTLRYASPEQVMNVARLDARSDVYSLGATLWELLALQPLFDATEQTPTPELMQRIQYEEPGRLRQANPAVPRDVAAIVEKCLQKDPRRRYGSARELGEELVRFLAGRPVKARPVGRLERTWRWCRRKPALAFASGGAAVAVLLALVTFAIAFFLVSAARDAALTLAGEKAALATQEQQQRRTAEKLAEHNRWLATQEQIARKNAEKAATAEKRAADKERQATAVATTRLQQIEKANKLLESIFLDIDPNAAQKGGPLLIEQLTRRLLNVADALDEAAIDDPLTVARLQSFLGNTLANLGESGKAIKLHQRARRTREKQLGPDHPATLTSMNNLALGYRAAGKLDLALPLYEDTLKRTKAKLGPDHPATLTSMNNLAGAYQAAGKLDLALPLFEDTLKRTKAKLGPDHPATLTSMNNLAEGYRAAGKLDLALPLFEATLKRTKAKLGPDHPATLTSMNNLANVYQDAGKLDLALPLYEDTLKRTKAKLGPGHPDTLTSMNNLAEGYRAAGKLDLALPLFEDTLKRTKAKLGPDHPNTLISMNNLASAYQDAGKLDLALPLFEDTLKHRKAKLGPDHPATLRSMDNLALAYFAAKQPGKAAALFHVYLVVRRKQWGADDPRYGGQLALFALDLLKYEQYTAAEPLLRECLKIRTKTAPDFWTTFNTKALLGAALLGQKKYADAQPLLVEGYDGMKARAKAIPPQGRQRLTEAEGRLAELFEATRQKHETKLQGRLTAAKAQAVHEIQLTAGKAVVLLMQTKDFDPLLRLVDRKGKLLAENDDINYAAKDLNSRIWFMPKADGVCRIVATSYQQQGRGDYQLIVRQYAAAKPRQK